MSVNNGSTYARNNLRHFNINHITKIPYCPQGKAIKNTIKYLLGKFYKIITKGVRSFVHLYHHMLYSYVNFNFLKI